jgi:hypothetical protein
MTGKPARPPKRGDMPHALTFFVSADERSAVLRRLRRHGKDRRLALLRALRIRSCHRPLL